ncbi:MAG: subclass B1 metallo-beta-lactamase [Planctomycetes bacterium]|nr:subclass B1 metallo-beta-lactamase [Planctomycetota bacterium]
MKIVCSAGLFRIFISMLLADILFVYSSGIGAESADKPIELSEDVTVTKLAEGVWLHTTYLDIQGYRRVPANGLIVVEGSRAMMIDLPWTDEQAGVLFDWIAKEHKAQIETVVPTHSHIDCAGGLAEAHRRKANSFALDKTVEILKRTDKPVPKNWFSRRLSLSCGQTRVELAFFGAGHTIDNITAWIPEKKILFAGCMIKSQNARNLGNTKEADLDQWPKTLKKVRKAFPEAKIVIPGHGRHSGTGLIDHTIELLKR